jgi:flagellin
LVDNSGDITGVQSNIAQGTYSFGVSTSGTAATVTLYNASGNTLGSAAVTTSATSAVISLANGQSVDLTLNGNLTNTTNATFVQNYSNADQANYSVTSSNAISQVQAAIQTVATMQGQFGAYQNQLQDISNNETVGIQNLTASNASIMDTNMASQMVAFTQDQVLVQAGVSMLAQANQIPQYVLKLLS